MRPSRALAATLFVSCVEYTFYISLNSGYMRTAVEAGPTVTKCLTVCVYGTCSQDDHEPVRVRAAY
jgi:hypothetical protein